MEIFFESAPYVLLTIWFVFSVYYLFRASRKPDNVNPYIFESIPLVFPTIGILGTFIGIAVGLWKFDVNNIETSIPALLQGLKTAFIASIFGIILSIIFSKFIALRLRKNERGKLSEETIALNKLIELISEMKNDFNNNFVYTDENNNRVKPANVFREIYEESRKQSQALQSFSTDLSTKIEAGFDTIMSNQIQKGVIPELQGLRTEIENLGKKLQDPTTEMTQNVVKELQIAMGKMIEEFKVSMSGSATNELEQLTKLLSQAGGSLTDFPAKLQSMTDNLNENFKGLQEVVQQIAKQTLSQSEQSTEQVKKQVEEMSEILKQIVKQTLSQSEQSTEQMRKQVEEMSEILKNKVGDLQIGQEVLMTKQSENLQVSDKLLNVFNTSIEKMNGLSNEVTETISKFSKVQSELNSAAGHLKSISESVSISTTTFKEAQLKFAQHSNEFLKNNSETIQEIQKSLSRAKDLSTDYAQKFGIIEKGLQGIFTQIQTGLNDYRDTVGESLESYLGKYTDALTKTAESLAGATSKQEDILEELTEQLSKLNIRRN
jgi:methyl-accepting chemotaxis protein